MKHLTLLSLLILFAQVLFAQNHTFSVQAANKDIGQVKTQRTVDGNREIYRIESDVETHIFGTIKISYTMDVVYENGVLIESDVKAYNNGKLHNSCQLKWNGDHYIVKKLDEDDSRLNEKIMFSVAKLYFEEPKGVEKVYSEFQGNMRYLDEESDEYKLHDRDGSHSAHYIYNERGELEETSSKHAVVTFHIRR